MSSASVPIETALTDDQRRTLESAHKALREAVLAYSQLHGPQPVADGVDPVWDDGAAIAGAQRAIEVAEATLWQLRAELLGWRRGPQTPSAALVADWVSDEDAVYDDLADEPGPGRLSRN